MKNSKYLLGLLALIWLGVSTAQAQSKAGSGLPCVQTNTLDKGCVGDCGNQDILQYTAKGTSNGHFCVQAASSTLGPDVGVTAVLWINGATHRSTDFTQVGSSISFVAERGDEIQVIIRTYPIGVSQFKKASGNLLVELKGFE